MSKTGLWLAMGCCLAASSALARAQNPMKPGLYETTSSMTWQKSPFPAGMNLPPQAAAAFGGGTHTTQVCLSQAWVDRFGGPIPQNRGDCHMNDLNMGPSGMSATMVCTGDMTGKGEVKADWTIGGSSKGSVHFAGAMSMRGNSMPIEWTVEFTSNFKGADCGSVKPLAVPADK